MDIKHTMDLAASLDTVYAAVATQAGIRGWWSRNSDVGESVGDAIELRFDKQGTAVVMKFQLTEASVESNAGRVKWTCTDNANPVWPGTTITWSMKRDGDKTQLELAHEGFKGEPSPPYQMTVEGWKPFVASLRAYAESGVGQPMG